MKYLAGLAKAHRGGGRAHLYTDTHATSIEGGENARVETSNKGHTVRADAVVVATNTPRQ